MGLTSERRRTILVCALLSAATLATFWPLTGHDFINYDDAAYVYQNPQVLKGLSPASMAWAFRAKCVGNWHPVTMLSHMADVQLFGVKPGWHHFTSLVFHVANTVLLFLVLQRMTRQAWPSAFVAGLFALHPFHVESVAWLAERKDVLSGFFFMLTLLAYCRNAEGRMKKAETSSPGDGTRFAFHVSPYYLLCLLFFALGLMSKPMLVTVPFVLLLLDYWPLGRVRNAECGVRSGGEPSTQAEATKLQPPVSSLPSLLLEKLPFFALAAASCVLTVWAQSDSSAVVPLKVLSLPTRAGNALVAYWTYLEKTFWPADLALFYPMRSQLRPTAVVVAAAALLGITFGAVAVARRRPHLPVGWFWFVGMLVPVIGLVQVGWQQMADRYTYLPLIGIFIMLAWQARERLREWRVPRAAGAVAAMVVLFACAAATRTQVGYWKNSESLFGHALKATKGNYVAHSAYGRALYKRGQVAEAISNYEAAIALEPQLGPAHYNLGEALIAQGRFEEAAAHLSQALRLRVKPVAVHVQLGIAQASQGKLKEAAESFAEALRYDAKDAVAQFNLGLTLTLLNQHQEAAEHLREALRLKPGYTEAHMPLADTCLKIGRPEEAIAQYREVIRLQPGSPIGYNNLAWILATHPSAQVRNGAEAVRLASKACELTRQQDLVPLVTLAAAYAECGQFKEAVTCAERAQELAKGGPPARSASLATMANTFRAGKPYHGN
jgi:protein O-mannosyl-transferase